jgi:exosome complex component RRP43
MRPVTLNIGSISTANGSAIVRIGSTLAMCGVQAELSDPHPTTPNEGFIVINVDYSNSVKILKDLSSSYIARTIEDLLINSKYIDLKDLLISEGKLCWTLFVDVMILSADGPPLDACVLATMAALKDVRLPKVETESGTPLVSMATCTPLLSTVSPPLMISFATHKKWKTLLDPTANEAIFCPGLLSIAVTNGNKLVGIYKLGGPPMTSEQLESCIKIARKQYQIQRKLIHTTTTTTTNNNK